MKKEIVAVCAVMILAGCGAGSDQSAEGSNIVPMPPAESMPKKVVAENISDQQAIQDEIAAADPALSDDIDVVDNDALLEEIDTIFDDIDQL